MGLCPQCTAVHYYQANSGQQTINNDSNTSEFLRLHRIWKWGRALPNAILARTVIFSYVPEFKLHTKLIEAKNSLALDRLKGQKRLRKFEL